MRTSLKIVDRIGLRKFLCDNVVSKVHSDFVAARHLESIWAKVVDRCEGFLTTLTHWDQFVVTIIRHEQCFESKPYRYLWSMNKDGFLSWTVNDQEIHNSQMILFEQCFCVERKRFSLWNKLKIINIYTFLFLVIKRETV